MDKENSTNSSIGDWEILAKVPDQKNEITTNQPDNEESETSGVEEIKKCHLNIPKFPVDGEISDGISVISEDELDECHADHHDDQESIDWQKEELQIGHQRKKAKKADEQLPLTPPSTPLAVDDDKDKQIQTLGPSEVQVVAAAPQPSPINFKKLLLFGGLATMILAILINNYQLNNLKNRGDFGYEQRITDLEIEKDILRDELERLKETLNVESAQPTSPMPDRKRRPSVSKQRQQQLNDQKIVWSGQENDPLVIPDSMNILPDFCTKTFSEHDDLYDEYNQVLCEKIQRKIDERTRNTNNFKKFNKELNKLRQEEGTAEIFVDIVNEEEVVQDSPKSVNGAHENKGPEKKPRMTKEQYEQYQREKRAKQEQHRQQSDDPKKRLTKEEYEQLKKEKNQQRDDDKKKTKRDDRKDRSTVDGSGGAQAHQKQKHNQNERSDKKRQYTVEEQIAYQEMKAKERQQSKEHKHKDRKDDGNDGRKDKKRHRKDSDEDDYDRSNEWHGKRMESREHVRQNKNENENWYLERGNDREYHRDHSGEKNKNWYLDRADEREVARTADEKKYQKHI